MVADIIAEFFFPRGLKNVSNDSKAPVIKVVKQVNINTGCSLIQLSTNMDFRDQGLRSSSINP